MLSAKDVAIVYETLLASPGMGDSVRFAVQIPRKQVLLLAKVIELGMQARKENPQGVLAAVDDPSIDSLQQVVVELLKKSGLTDMNERLNALQVK